MKVAGSCRCVHHTPTHPRTTSTISTTSRPQVCVCVCVWGGGGIQLCVAVTEGGLPVCYKDKPGRRMHGNGEEGQLCGSDVCKTVRSCTVLWLAGWHSHASQLYWGLSISEIKWPHSGRLRSIGSSRVTVLTVLTSLRWLTPEGPPRCCLHLQKAKTEV